MSPSSPLRLSLALSAVILASCGENPVQPRAVDVSPTMDLGPFGCGPGCWSLVSEALSGRVWRYGIAAGVVHRTGGQSTVYILGGRFNQAPSDPAAETIVAYDVRSGSWKTKAARFTGASTNGIATINSKLYISGGTELVGGEWRPLSSKLFVYDPAADRLIRKADLPRASADGVSGDIDDKLYVLAGKCPLNDLCRSFFRYDPATNRWTTLPSAPHSHVHGAAAVLGGKFYVAGGGSSPFRWFDVYDPATNRWTSPGLLPPRRQFAAGANLNGRFFVVGIEGGDRTGVRFADRNVVAYHPGTNSWRNVTSYPGPDGDFGQFLLRPQAVVRVAFDGAGYLLALGSGHLYTDDTVKPAGTIDPGPPYIYTP